MEAFPQVVQKGTLTCVGVQEHKVLDAHAIPGRKGRLHVPQDPVTPLLEALCRNMIDWIWKQQKNMYR